MYLFYGRRAENLHWSSWKYRLRIAKECPAKAVTVYGLADALLGYKLISLLHEIWGSQGGEDDYDLVGGDAVWTRK
jgi:hypothetical protein